MPGRGFGKFFSEFDGRIKRCQQRARWHNPRFRFLGNSPKPKTTSQLGDVHESADLDEKRILLEFGSDNAENVSTPTRALELAESDANSDTEKTHFSETLKKYVTYLKSIKCPKIINNSELLDGVDRVSRSIEGCIKLAETTLGSSTS